MDNKIYDVVILGAGPAGLAAGLYAGRSRLSVLILEKGIDGGQIAVTHDIENYPGQSKVDGMTGQELVAPMTEQCKKFGCERVSDTITACDFSGPVKKFVGSKGEYLGKTVIVCTGAMTRSIGCKNEAKYVGKGISYCAVCDANFFEDFEIYVVGGNGIAAEESLYLAGYARKVTMIHKGPALTVSPMLKERLDAEPKIHVEGGYIKTDECMRTNVPGVFAAGDVRVTPLRQVVTACADGAIAAMQCYKYISAQK